MAFQNADELWSHVKTTHLRQTNTISCLWDGCSAEHPSIEDAEIHMSKAHHLKVDSEAELFAGFQVRADYEELSPSQCQISNGVAIFSKSGPTGPDRPQFHQVYCREVSVLPGFCPGASSMSRDIQHRMTQHVHRDRMRLHLWDHLHGEADQALCPSPACGRKLYSHDKLQMHMVLQHRLSLFGSAGGGAHYTKLRLPSASSTVTSSTPTPENTIPTPITLTATSSSSKRPLTDASDSGSNSAKRSRLKPLQPPVIFTPTIIPAGLFSRVDALASPNNSSARVNKKSQDDLGGEGLIFSGSIKSLKAPQLKDLARSLELEETGTREVLRDRILKHFNLPENQSLKEDKHFVDLWNRRRRRVAGPKQTEDVLTDSQKVASRAGSSIQQDFGMLPPPNPPYQFPDMWIPPEPHVHYQHTNDNPPPSLPRSTHTCRHRYPRDRPPSTNTRTPLRDTFTTLHNNRNLSLRSLTP
ncbi:hypothetical protein B0H13DRAFT_2326903 [Mycena leptocephala]|nr:hypothetical protein B0H13DRAFT_2326903 [Mycena leptocephala]